MLFFVQNIDGFKDKYLDRLRETFKVKNTNGKAIQKMKITDWDEIYGIRDSNIQLDIRNFVDSKIKNKL